MPLQNQLKNIVPGWESIRQSLESLQGIETDHQSDRERRLFTVSGTGIEAGEDLRVQVEDIFQYEEDES